MNGARISVVVPAYNEAAVLPETLARIDAEAAEVIVVDNGSTERTAEIAEDAGARVVSEPRRGVARARNAGAAMARGDVLVFVDADVLLPDGALARVARSMSDPGCLGCAFDTEYRPRRRSIGL